MLFVAKKRSFFLLKNNVFLRIESLFVKNEQILKMSGFNICLD